MAETKIKHAGPRDKTINIKIAINTARMMVARESAAPDLLKLVKMAVNRGSIPTGSTWFIDARAAIRKAEGGE